MKNIQPLSTVTILFFSSLLASCSIPKPTKQNVSPNTKASVVAEISPHCKVLKFMRWKIIGNK